MKVTKLLSLLLIVLSITMFSCKKDGASATTDGSSVNPNNYEDPEGTITANLRNDGGSISILDTELRINTADNFVGGDNSHVMTFVSIGGVNGLGYINTIPQSGWSNQVAVIPENGYVVKCLSNGVVNYARIYVVRYILSANNEILGAEIKYQDNWTPYPIVVTKDLTDVTATSAMCGGCVTNEGGSSVTERGICWSTSSGPTIIDNHKSSGTGAGDFTIQITDLLPDVIYYVRAYAKNSIGISYGSEKIIHVPVGAIEGVFSVSSDTKVFFSQGNLQYQASTNTWRFAENQYDYIGDDNANISPTYNGWIDLFGWGTGNNPTNSSTNNGDYPTFNDWGNNAISNGGNTTNSWRTLTKNEWVYIFYTRNTASGIKYAKAQVNGVKGVILLPDDWNNAIYSLYNTNNDYTSYNSNIISMSDWTGKLEANGAIFMPAAGNRHGTTVHYVCLCSLIWSNTCEGGDSAHGVWVEDGIIDAGHCSYRYIGQSVRLVCSAE